MEMFLQLLGFLTSEAHQVVFTANCVVLICPILKQYLKLNIFENIQNLFLLWQKNSPKTFEPTPCHYFLRLLHKKGKTKNYFRFFQCMFY